MPVTKLGRLVASGKIKTLEEIYLFSLPIKEFEIIDHFIGPALKDEVLKIMPVQKQTRAGQRTRFKVSCGSFLNTQWCEKILKILDYWIWGTSPAIRPLQEVSTVLRWNWWKQYQIPAPCVAVHDMDLQF